MGQEGKEEGGMVGERDVEDNKTGGGGGGQGSKVEWIDGWVRASMRQQR